MSKVRLIIDVNGNPEVQPGGNYYYSMAHGKSRGGKQIILRDSDIVQSIDLGPEEKPASFYDREIARYQKMLAADKDAGRSTKRLELIAARINALEVQRLKAEEQDGQVLRERYRYAIVLVREPEDLHRGPMTYDEAKAWMDDWYEMCDENPGMNRNAFKMIRQPIGEWEDYEG